MSNSQSKLKTSQIHRRGIVRLHLIPLLVWLCAMAGAVFLFSTRIQRFETMGMAHSKTFLLSAETTARIKSMHVELFDPVKKGQVITRLDSELLEAQLNTIKAEIERLKAELAAEEDRLEIEAHDRLKDYNSEYRNFASDIENARLEVLELKAIIEPDRILLEDYKTEIDIETELYAKGASASKYNIEKMQAQYDSLASKIKENETLLAQAETKLTNTIKRRNEFLKVQSEQPWNDDSLEAISKSIDVQQQLMKELLVQTKSLTLKAPTDGIITQINQSTGEVVTPEMPILAISEPNPTHVIAYAADAAHNSIKPNQKVELIKNGSSPQVAQSQIIEIGPSMEMLPERLQSRPDTLQWGRPFLVKIPPGMTLVPGEKVGIRGLYKK